MIREYNYSLGKCHGLNLRGVASKLLVVDVYLNTRWFYMYLVTFLWLQEEVTIAVWEFFGLVWLMSMMKRRGPSMEPCRTPADTLLKLLRDYDVQESGGV